MADPVVLNIQFEADGGIQLHWTRPEAHSEYDATYYTTLVSREGQEADPQLTYWGNELHQDALEFLFAFLKVQNSKD